MDVTKNNLENFVKPQRDKVIMMILCMAILICSLALSSVNVALPSLVVDLESDFIHVQWVVIAFILSSTFTLIIAGRLGDIYGYKQLFLIGVVIFTLSSGLSVLVDSLWPIVALRVIQGVGSGIILTISMAIVSNITPKNKLGKPLGLLGSMSAVGTGVGPLLGGMLIDSFGWFSLFIINIPLGCTIYYLALKYFPVDQKGKRESFTDFVGAALFILAILTFTLSIKTASSGFKPFNYILLCVSALALVKFLRIQRQASYPTLDISLLNHWPFSLTLISSFFVSIVVMTSLVIGPFYLIETLGLSTTFAGLVMGVSPAIVACVSFLVGKQSSLVDLRVLTLLGSLILLIGVLGMTQIKIEFGVIGYTLCLSVTAIGYGTFLSSNNTFSMTQASRNNRGSVSGLLNLARSLGLLTGASLMSNIFASKTTMTGSVETGLQASYTVAAILIVALITIQLTTLFKQRLKQRHFKNF